MGLLKTATFRVDIDLLFTMFGLPHLAAKIDSIELSKRNDRELIFKISGVDDRIPDRADYPLCDVIARVVASHFEVVK